jgi:hypothetical protein
VGPWLLDGLEPGERRLVTLADTTDPGHAPAGGGVTDSSKRGPGRHPLGQRRRRR